MGESKIRNAKTKSAQPPISLHELAELLGLSPRRVQQLASDGTIPREKHGVYQLRPAVQAYCAHLVATRQPDGKLDATQERARRDAAAATAIEIKNDIACGRVVLIDDVEREVVQLLSILKKRLGGLSMLITARVPASVKQVVFSVADEEICRALAELSEGAARKRKASAG